MSFSPTESMYSKIENLIKQKQNPTLVNVYNVSMLYLFVRLLLMHYYMQYKPVKNYLIFDHVCSCFYNSGLQQRDIFLTLLPIFIFFMFILNQIILVKNHLLWKTIYFGVIKTIGNFFQNNVDIFKNFSIFNFYKKIKKLFKIFYFLFFKPRKINFGFNLNVSPFQKISTTFKCKIVLFWIIFEVGTQIEYISCKFKKIDLKINF